MFGNYLTSRDTPVFVCADRLTAEITHQKFADLSITWNSIDPVRNSTWSNGDDNDPEIHTFNLAWRRDTMPRLAALEGTRLHEISDQELAEPSGLVSTETGVTSPASRGFQVLLHCEPGARDKD
ncbi:hypothetical protein [Nocardia colli]|uniref:hypothetical protein n=1 Tax=Nocardia colli TaxID=2545717 RepID=UPI0035D9155D